jgi:DNA ligase (NAD+)
MPKATDIEEKSQALLAELPDLDASELEELVRHHNAAYFERDAAEISDPAFDKLVEALRFANPQAAVLSEMGEGKVKKPDRRFKQVKHKVPMLSLDKCYDDETLHKWRDKVEGGIIAMPKIDGVACSMRFGADGKMVLATTRGDGKSGDDITKNARQIPEIPNPLPGKRIQGALAEGEDEVEVRGEVYMSLKRFRDIYAADFANPRNLTAGALKQKDPKKSGEYQLSFFPYDILGTQLATEREKFQLIADLGFSHVDVTYVPEDGDPAEAYRALDKARPDLDYEVDGMVFRADRVSEQKRLGLTAHHPRWAMAYKFQGDSAQTQLVRVEWSVGRSGVITPVAVVNPVYVSGATVTRATLHNLGRVRELGLKKTSLVELVRRGGVIPHVEAVLRAEGRKIQPPKKCPSCDREALVDGDFVRCSRPSECRDVIIARVSHFCRVVDLLGFGKKHLQNLIDKKMVRSPADLYRLTVEDLVPLERMGQKLAERLTGEVAARRQMTLPVFVTALGIDEVGPTVARAIVAHHKSVASLRKAEADELGEIHGVGEAIAQSLVQGLSENADLIDDLLSVVEIVEEEAAPVVEGHPFSGRGVVFTGKMAHMDRKDAQKAVKKVGGSTPSSVTRDTAFLVIGDDGSPLLGDGKKSTKQKKAETLKEKGAAIQIITETAFLKMLGSDGAPS